MITRNLLIYVPAAILFAIPVWSQEAPAVPDENPSDEQQDVQNAPDDGAAPDVVEDEAAPASDGATKEATEEATQETTEELAPAAPAADERSEALPAEEGDEQEAASTAPGRTDYVCRAGALVREVSVVAEPGEGRLCEVRYRRPTEDSLDTVLWHANNNPHYCAGKAGGLIEKLNSFGWSCTKSVHTLVAENEPIEEDLE